MNWRQLVDSRCMLTGNRQLDIAIVEQTATQQVRVGSKLVATKTVLDGDFPNTGGTKPQLVRLIRHQRMRFNREFLRLPRCPQQQMCVQQKDHSSPSNMRRISSSANRLKSSGIRNSASFKNPKRQGFLLTTGSSGTTLTIGLPALAITKDSPFAARSTRR